MPAYPCCCLLPAAADDGRHVASPCSTSHPQAEGADGCCSRRWPCRPGMSKSLLAAPADGVLAVQMRLRMRVRLAEARGQQAGAGARRPPPSGAVVCLVPISTAASNGIRDAGVHRPRTACCELHRGRWAKRKRALDGALRSSHVRRGQRAKRDRRPPPTAVAVAGAPTLVSAAGGSRQRRASSVCAPACCTLPCSPSLHPLRPLQLPASAPAGSAAPLSVPRGLVVGASPAQRSATIEPRWSACCIAAAVRWRPCLTPARRRRPFSHAAPGRRGSMEHGARSVAPFARGLAEGLRLRRTPVIFAGAAHAQRTLQQLLQQRSDAA